MSGNLTTSMTVNILGQKHEIILTMSARKKMGRRVGGGGKGVRGREGEGELKNTKLDHLHVPTRQGDCKLHVPQT